MKLESILFRIENLKDLSSSYVLFEIFGLAEIDDDYDTNVQHIIKSLSYSLKHPVTVIFKEKKPFLVVRNDQKILDKLPLEYPVKRGAVVDFKRSGQPLDLDFENYTEETKGIILRFLQFDIATELNKNSRIWQPSAGDAFFNCVPMNTQTKISVFSGFDVRVAELPGGGLGLAIDVTKKYVDSQPLNVYLTRHEFRKYGIDKCHLVYHYGNKRYEIKAKEYSDLNITQSKFLRKSDGETVTLLQDIREKFGTTMPPEVANLPDDAAVLIYQTNDGEERKVPAGLCYRVYDTEDPLVKKIHRKSIIDPFYRRRLIRIAYTNYLSKLKFGKIPLQVNPNPTILKQQKFIAPDVRFGNDTVLSVRGTEGAIQTTMLKLGRMRKELLNRENAGFYTNAEFELQYFLVPVTAYNMYVNDENFLSDLKYQVNKMHSSETPWEPIPIPYDNRNKTDAIDIGFAIINAFEEKIGRKKNGGYALVMLPSGVEKEKRKHDELAALVVWQFQQEYNITASIMHSQTLEACYTYKPNGTNPGYYILPESRGLYSGYIQGVALNQVLLNNERWPFILETPLHADLTIGVDVKRHIAGFTFIDKVSKNILTKDDKTINKEGLAKSQVIRMLTKYITIQVKHAGYPIKRIVLHRDGRLFRQERQGALEAIQILIQKNILPVDATLSFAEIPKHSISPFRMFNISEEFDIIKQDEDNGLVSNPESGSWVPINGREAFLCTTGREYTQHHGSTRPLYIKTEPNGLTMEQILEDIYFLSCLTYTKPDDCSRYPLTIKITDRRINTLGSEFNVDALDILKSTY